MTRLRPALGIVLAVLVVILAASAVNWATDYALLVGFEVFQLAALAQAWSLLAGYGGVVSLAVSGFVGIGSYAAAKFSAAAGWGVVPCLLVACGFAAAFAAIVSVPMFRFKGIYFTIGSLVLAQALALFVSNSSVLGGNQGVLLGGQTPDQFEIYRLGLIVAVLATVVAWAFSRSKFGLGLRAVRDDEDVAGRMGVNVFRLKLAGFVVGAAIMGLVGGIQAIRTGYVQPGGAFTLNWTIDTVNAGIIGGPGTLLGPLIGAAASVGLNESLGQYAELHLIIIGAVLIAVIRLAPRGLWGEAVARFSRFSRSARTSTHLTVPLPAPDVRGSDRKADVPREPQGLLVATGVGKAFGGVPAVSDVDLQIRAHEVLGIVGPNGAGKSTLIGLISGAIRGTGRVVYRDQDVTDLGARARAHHGIARTHQVPRPFEQLSVMDNLLVAYRHRNKTGKRAAEAACLAILDRCGLREFAGTPASELGLLRLKRLELARALALSPTILLLDEIGAGLVESEVAELIDLITSLRTEVQAIVIVEHVLEVIRSCCDRLVVLNRGQVLTEGTPNEVLADVRVAEVYLGTTDATAVTSRPIRPAKGPLLEVSGISAQYGKHRAINGLDLTVAEGEVLALVGTNGAGKTTTARAVSGGLPVTSGTICWQGKRVDGLPSYRLVRLGIAHCMEGRRIFADLSVAENLLLGGRGVASVERQRRLDGVYELFPDLAEKQRIPGASLSGGQQQMLAIGRALMSAPKLIIFDEISLGLAPITVDRLYRALETINDSGVAMILIEQNVDRALSLADNVAVLEKGSVALQGKPDDIRRDPRLNALYVGQAV
jgi:branched-chain amino acid transport system ATP-binding protein